MFELHSSLPPSFEVISDCEFMEKAHGPIDDRCITVPV
jgi:hypothetical protein